MYFQFKKKYNEEIMAKRLRFYFIKNMVKYLVLVPIFVVILGCDFGRQDKFNTELTGDTLKYWRRYSNLLTTKYCGGFCFYSNGTYSGYQCEFKTGVRYVNELFPEEKRIWKLVNDSVMVLGDGFLYKIVYFNNDSLILDNLQVNGTDEYLKLTVDKDQVTQPVVDTLEHKTSFPRM